MRGKIVLFLDPSVAQENAISFKLRKIVRFSHHSMAKKTASNKQIR